MPKVVLPRFNSGYLSLDKINSAMADIEVAFENTISRDGDIPNQMQADIDLNGFDLLNTGGDPNNPTRVVTYQDLVDYVLAQSAGIVLQKIQNITATSGQTLFTLTDFEYTPGSNNLSVYREGIRQVKGIDYVETSASVVTFLAGVTLNDVVTFVSNDYLGTVNLPAHTHTWDQITAKPDTATRWPDWAEVTGKPATFTPSSHVHAASDITTGRLADARRGVYVQATEPTGLGAGDAGVLWLW